MITYLIVRLVMYRQNKQFYKWLEQARNWHVE